MKISNEVKENIYNYLVSSMAKPFWNENSNVSFLAYDFFSQVWDLQSLPVIDSRYSTAKEEIEKNLDLKIWTFDYVLIERLNILKETPSFVRFIEAIISPNYNTNSNEQALHLFAINNELENDGLLLRAERESNTYKIYEITEDDIDGLELRKSKYNFYVAKYREKIPDEIQSLSEYFVLYESNWDDYNSKTTFSLSFWKGSELIENFGQVKIMTKGENITMNVIPRNFSIIPQKFCSLGQSESFYFSIFKLFPNDFSTILSALGDCAFFSDKLEAYENHPRFIDSLIRDDENERILRVIKYKILNYDLSKLFNFTYEFKPPYSKNSVDIKFEFPAHREKKFGFYHNEIISNRIYAIIGKNGTGKTQLLNSLPKNITSNVEKLFTPRIPGFSKLIHVSYSIFDTFKASSIPNKTQYVYCGLKDDNGDLIDSRRLLLRFHNSWKKIKTRKRIGRWREILSQIIDVELLKQFILEDRNDFYNGFRVDISKFHEVKDKLSSGQNILLFIITEIVANIRYDSLILYDEPETHLHPNAITQLVNTIYQLVDEFESFCIIGTHSPLVIQELLSKNVYIIERNENYPSIRKIEIESFGENLSKLTDDVFGNREVAKKYKNIIKNQISFGKSFEEIERLLISDDVPLSLNLKLYIASQLARNEKS